MSSYDRVSAIPELYRVLKTGGYLFSRQFKKRSRKWVKSLPIYKESFGINKTELNKMFGEYFSPEIWKYHPDMYYIKAEKK
jgi:ubiquinone/menaquinone biosynthesis C-methylase UbiE